MTTTVRTENLLLGYAVGSGAPVHIPVNHMAVTGQTQMSGKTTTLEALISRSDLRAVAFVTKRGERSFQGAEPLRRIPPYFRERADWQFVAAVLEATLRERLKFERSWIMRACKGAKSLADVQRNVRKALETAKGLSADVYLTLDEYLKIVVPQIEKLPYSKTLELAAGLSVMDLAAYTSELQALVIRSVLEAVYQREHNTVVIIPEAWEFLPLKRGGPVKLAAEELIRKGAGLRNFIWLDSQDLAAVDTAIRKSVIVWLLGVQREANEVKRVLDHIPNAPKPKLDDIMQLRRGEFFACWADRVIKVYVQPAWMDDQDAVAVARGEATVEGVEFYRDLNDALTEGDEMSAEERAQSERRIADLESKAGAALAEVTRLKNEKMRLTQDHAAELSGLTEQLRAADAFKLALMNFLPDGKVARLRVDSKSLDIESIVAEVVRRLPAGGSVVQVTPPEALRKDFQQQEVERLLVFLRELEARPRNAVLLLEGSGEWIGQKALAARLAIPTAGNSFITFIGALKKLAADGWVQIEDRRGVTGRMKSKIAEDLAYYKPTLDDIEQVYQHALAVLAGEKQPA